MRNAGRLSMKAVTLLASLAFLLGVSTSMVSGQTTEADSQKKKAIKFDEIGDVGMCELRQRLNRFTTALSNKPDNQGYIINYSGDSGAIGDKQIARRERVITDTIASRNYDRNRITLVRGGQRLEESTELWLVPPGSENPAPSGTIDSSDSRSTPEVEEREEGTYLFEAKHLEFYNQALDEFMLPSAKDSGGDQDEQPSSTGPAGDDDTEDPDSGSADTEKTVFAALRIEDKESVRFRWADVAIAEYIARNKGSRGVLYFYADDERYDIKKLQAFVEHGRDLLAKNVPLAKSRLTVEYGGYRKSLEAEFWFVPRGGRPPTASPEERCSDDLEN